MLENLYIKNVALIKEQNIDLSSGLNIVSGESGSGKSMFIDAINFILGNRPKTDFIRHEEDEAFVYATFYIENDETIKLIKNFDIDVLDDNLVQIKRSINIKNKSTIKINDRVVTLGTLKTVSNFLVDIHLQKDNYDILKRSSHIEYLDFVCQDALSVHKKTLSEKVLQYKQLSKKLENLIKDEQEKLRKLDILNFEFDELDNANLVVGEDIELLEQQKKLANAEKISDNSSNIVDLLYNSDEGMSAYDKVTSAISLLEGIEDVSENIKILKNSLVECQINIEDISLAIRDYSSDIGVSKEELTEIDERLSLIFKLKKKYGKSIDEILDYKDEIESEIYILSNSDKIIAKLKAELDMLETECLEICKEITSIRKKEVKPVSKSLISTLRDLGMNDVNFDVKITEKDNFDETGKDDVSFYISTNKGQDLKPLEKIVSGGEMSRIMIAIKELISKNYQIETFIFDEIDTGVSGRTAQRVGEKLSEISVAHQIICITHLPQIASIGDSNILIFKKIINNKTFTNIERLDDDGKIAEIARLIGGKSINEQTIEYAKEMVNMAKNN